MEIIATKFNIIYRELLFLMIGMSTIEFHDSTSDCNCAINSTESDKDVIVIIKSEVNCLNRTKQWHRLSFNEINEFWKHQRCKEKSIGKFPLARVSFLVRLYDQENRKLSRRI